MHQWVGSIYGLSDNCCVFVRVFSFSVFWFSCPVACFGVLITSGLLSIVHEDTPGLDLELSYEVMEGVSYSGRGVASIVCSASVYIYPLRSPYGVQVWPSVCISLYVSFFFFLRQ